VRRTAAARGLNEAITWSFIAEDDADRFGGGEFQVANPISEDMKVMRPSLLPGLLAAARRNLDRSAQTVRLFEIGRRYLAEGERPTLTLLLAGNKGQRDWQAGKPGEFSAFDAKAETLALLEAAGAPVANLQAFPGAGPTWHPGRSASLGLGPKTILARFGEVHPELTRGLPSGTVAAEIYLDAIPPQRSSSRTRPAFTPYALQPLRRDFAFVVPADLVAGDLVRAVAGADKAVISGVRLFDRFESSQALSLALEVTLQPTDKSFTEEQITDISARIVAAAEKLGARLRA
jgi:phenylalanyl-tRNA synthetase beta chain